MFLFMIKGSFSLRFWIWFKSQDVGKLCTIHGEFGTILQEQMDALIKPINSTEVLLILETEQNLIEGYLHV